MASSTGRAGGCGGLFWLLGLKRAQQKATKVAIVCRNLFLLGPTVKWNELERNATRGHGRCGRFWKRVGHAGHQSTILTRGFDWLYLIQWPMPSLPFLFVTDLIETMIRFWQLPIFQLSNATAPCQFFGNVALIHFVGQKLGSNCISWL